MTYRWMLVVLLVLGGAYRAAAVEPGAALPAPGNVQLGAHRGGMGEWPENTLMAWQQAATRYPGILLEGDMRLTKDGQVVLLHDAEVDRTTDGTGLVSGYTLSELKKLDAGFHFSPDGGASHPFRGRGVTIPTLDEVLSALPESHALLELKDGAGLAAAAASVIHKHHAEARVTVASFKPALLNEFRALAPKVAVCFDTVRAIGLLGALRGAGWEDYTPDATVLSLPKNYVAQFSLTAVDIAAMRAKGIHVQVHTVNEIDEFRRFAELGVDSVLSDFPGRLLEALEKAD